MLPGPDLIIECPACHAPARVQTLESGNTLGATLWTDGKMIAPMLPEFPELTSCRNCGSYFWISDAKVLAELERRHPESRAIPAHWESAEVVKELSAAEYLEALETGVARKREQELYIRLHAWWAANDSYRSSGKTTRKKSTNPPQRSPEATMNLERLLDLLDVTDPEERLMKAEVLRELGRFDGALELFDFDFPKDYAAAAAFIRNLAENKDPLVREFAF